MYELQTLDRALLMLSVLSEASPLRLTDLSERLAANQTTVLRTLRVLEKHGYVRRSGETGEYSLGTRLAELGLAAVKGIDAVSVLKPLTKSLSEKFSTTVHIGMVRDGSITVIDKVDSASLVRYSALGTRMPLHATAAGKAALARMGSGAVRALIQEPQLHRYTERTIVTESELLAEVGRTQSRGYGIEREEFHLGFACVGSAFRLNSDIYTVALSGPLIPEDDLHTRGSYLRQELGDLLAGYRGVAVGLSEEDAILGFD